MHGIDIGRKLSLDEINYLAGSNFGFVARYLDGSRGASPKSLNTDEVAAILSRRLGIVPVFEISGAVFTGAQGLSDGLAARADALALSMPLGFPIPFAVDVDVVGDPGNTLVDYFNGVFQGLDGAYTAGVYGEYDVCRFARENFPALGYFWQTYAWSAGKVYAPADVLQHANGVSLMGGQLVVDLNSAPTPPRWRIA